MRGLKKVKNKIIYTFTAERLIEFKDRNLGQIINSTTYLNNLDNKLDLKNDFNYYVDISNLYKSNIDMKNLLIEKILANSFAQDNIYILLDENSKSKFKEEFITSFDGFKTIQTIYGEGRNYNIDFITMSNENLKELGKSLQKDLIGHDRFKEDFLEKIKNFPILYKLDEMKIFSLLINGNPGVGKTEVARILHKSLYPDSKMIKINLGNYKTQGALNSLIGSPIGFIGSERGGELSNKIRNSDSKIILIDELEKADTDIFNFFYELLEDGKFTDLTGNEYDLNGYVIIFTTNLSKNNYKEILPPPLISRFTLKSFFEDPNNEEKRAFIEKRIKKLLALYKTENLQPQITDKEIRNNLDYETINKISDFRVINRIIISALTRAIDNAKDNTYKKLSRKRKKGADK